MPQSFEAEQALLGAILSNNAAYHQCAEIVALRHFSVPLRSKSFETMASLIERGQVDMLLTLKTYFEVDPELKTTGWPAYLADMMAASVHALDAPTFARLIRDTALRRRIIELANNALLAA